MSRYPAKIAVRRLRLVWPLVFWTSLAFPLILALPASLPGVRGGSASAVKFVDVTQELGIHFKHESSPTTQKYLLETMGSGVALFDCDQFGNSLPTSPSWQVQQIALRDCLR